MAVRPTCIPLSLTFLAHLQISALCFLHSAIIAGGMAAVPSASARPRGGQTKLAVTWHDIRKTFRKTQYSEP
jgi:hypothetical protein